VPIALIEKEHDWNLNLRRYVDNTPPPEPEDVHCHLVGGVPKAEVEAAAAKHQYAKFGIKPGCVLEKLDDQRQKFKDGLASAADVRRRVEEQPQLAATCKKLNDALAEWWKTAKHDFAELAPGAAAAMKDAPASSAHLTLTDTRLPRVRATLRDQIVEQLEPLGVLDGYQSRGVFVNWWDNIKYDLKTITSLGWSPTLIPEPMVVDRFFDAERGALDALERQIAEDEAAVAEAVENAQTILEYEPDEDETISAATIRPLLKEAIGDEETEENKPLRDAAEALKKAEVALKEHKAESDRLDAELKLKVELKLYGPEDKIEEWRTVLTAAETELAALGGSPPENPPKRAKGAPKPTAEEKERLKQRKALAADVATLTARIASVRQMMEQMGGVISTEQARELILQKHHEYVAGHLQRYVQAEEHALFGIFENLFNKYADSSRSMEMTRTKTLGELEGFLNKLRYV
jgi:type I restriction enzyme M protein